MPTRPHSPCLTPRCSGRSTHRGRCQPCAARYDRQRGTATERGYNDPAWRALSAQVLREEPTCREPGCSRPSQHADHIRSVKSAPHLRLTRSNVRGLCHSHHSRRTVLDDGGFGRRPGPRAHDQSSNLPAITIPPSGARTFAFKKVPPARNSAETRNSSAIVVDGARSAADATDARQSNAMARDCVICRKPMLDTAPSRRGRPRRTHAGRCKRIIDARHRAAARAERFATMFAARGNSARAAKAAAYARQLRAACGEATEAAHG